MGRDWGLTSLQKPAVLAPVGPPLWAEFPLDRPRAPFQLLTLQGER